MSLYKLLLQAAVDELETKIKECNSKGADDVLVSQKATVAAARRRTTANTPAGRRLFFIPYCNLMKYYNIRRKKGDTVT
jgi:hypothetical protein